MVLSGTEILRATGATIEPSPGVVTQAPPASASLAGFTYRKNTPKTVASTVAATDLLNSEITVAANAMGLTGLLRLVCWGDWLQNSGSTVASPRFQVVFGTTPLLDTGISGTAVSGAVRSSWRLVLEILNLGVSDSQMSYMSLSLMNNNISTQVQNTFATGEGILTSISATGQVVFGEGVNSTGVNTSAANALVLNVINGSSSATYETKLLGAFVIGGVR